MAKGLKTGGRKVGVVNKSTALAREAIARFVDGNADKLEEWLVSIAADSPKDAFNCFMSVAEYHVPKLARSELVGDPERPLHINISQSDQELIARYTTQKKDTK